MSTEQSDHDLLKWAAKAAGITYSISNNGTFLITQSDNPNATVCWNPLENDGDAMRLSVKLKINVYHAENLAYAQIPGDILHEERLVYVSVDSDPYVANRRAIVMAAAEIGKGMK